MVADTFLSPLVYGNSQISLDGTYGAGVANTVRFPASATLYSNPFSVQAGETNPLTYFASSAATAMQNVSALLLKAEYDALTAGYTAFSTSVTAYNTLKDTYNTALKTEKTRQADFFKAAMDAPTKIPARPCAPTTPAAYTGPASMVYATLFSALSTAQKGNKSAAP